MVKLGFNMKVITVIMFMCTSLLVTSLGSVAEEREFRPGRGGSKRGNENSQRVRNVRVDRPQHAGNGCPEGTMRVVFAPDNLSFTVIYDQFIAELKGEGGAPRDRMQCQMVLPVEIPEGQQMEITRVDYRGFAGLPEGTQAALHSIVGFQSRGNINSGKTLRYTFTGPLMDTYEISTGAMNEDKRGRGKRDVSPCGGVAQLRIANQLTVRSRGQQREGMITLDSIDGSQNMIYHINWTSCSEEEAPGRRAKRSSSRNSTS